MKAKRFLLAMFAILTCVQAWSADGDTFSVWVGGINWTFRIISETDKTCRVGTGEGAAVYSSTSGNVTIPASVNGYKVVEIANKAFNRCENITSIEIPNSVTSIEGGAFLWCSGLTSIEIPKSVVDIGTNPFRYCLGVTSITVDADNPVYESPNGCNVIIRTADNTLMAGCSETIIPNSVTSIGDYAFYGSRNLTSIIIPNSVTSIGSNAFGGCSGLTSITIPNSVTSIGSYAFANCSGLTSITIPNSVTSIEDHTFWYCSGLISVIIPNSVTSIGDDAFYECTSLTSVTVKNETPININSGTFPNRTNATLYVPAGSRAAYIAANYWKQFKKIIDYPVLTFSDANVKAICVEYWDTNGDEELSEAEAAAVTSSKLAEAFENNKKITSFNELQYFIGLTSINEAFYYCSNLSSVVIPENVTTIVNSAFCGCSSLSSIIIPDKVTRIGASVFSGCSNLSSVVLPSSLEEIDNDAFLGCNLISVVIPDHVTTIGMSAFRGNDALTSVKIPSSVNSIGSQAFRFCPNLTSVTIEIETPIAISDYEFANGNIANATLYVPVGCKAAYEAADGWKDFGTIVEMGNAITIGSAGMGTFCSTHPLDFSGTDDIKAYIVSAFKPSTGEVTLTRITDVPANTGIVVKGNAGDYTIPFGAGETVVANMLVGVTEDTPLNKVDGDYTNYILANKGGDLGFYAVADGSTLSAGKAYLPLPTAQLPSVSGAPRMTMIFDDDETTGIQQIQSDVKSNGDYYDLQGRRVLTPTRGLYIVNGKKVFIK